MLLGCATGPPAGARASLDQARYRSYAPPSAPPSSAPRQNPYDLAPPSAAPPGPMAPPPSLAPGQLPSQDDRRQRVLEIARSLIGSTKIALAGKKYRDDCTAVPLATYEQVGLDLFSAAERGDNGVTAIYRYAQRHGRVYRGGWPVPGDLVFFRETYDLNGDGRVNDGLTHIGLVESVGQDATVTVIHRVRRGVVRYRMNLNHPDWRTDPESGAPINDYLRAAGAASPAMLTGQLFAAYATVLDGPGLGPVATR
jgi:hypothetical protein